MEGYRKTIAFALALAATVGMAFAGISTGEPYWAIVGLLTAFIGGNAFEHLKGKTGKGVAK